MNRHKSWYNQDEFWKLYQPILFDEQRLASAVVEVEQVIRLLQIHEGSRILDLCCGIGRHSLEFSRRGFEVVGLDRTARYIDQNIKQAKEEGLKAQFVVRDMREYCQPEAFDAIINMFGSFGYFQNADDDRKVARNMAASLKAGGKFLIETMGKEVLAKIFRERDWHETDDCLVLEERTLSQHWGWIESRWILIKGNQRAEHKISLRLYSAVELSALLKESGFSEVQVYGSLEGSDYDQNARRLVVVAGK